MPNDANLLPTVLCIGGLDPSGGAGLTADARACAAFGAHAFPITTAIVVQNTQGVKLIEPIAPEIIAAQLETLLEDVEPAAIKIGMIPGLAALEVIAAHLQPFRGRAPIVVDTVFAPSNGAAFNDQMAIDAIAGQLLPMATIVTPNALEAAQLGAGEISDIDTLARAAIAVFERTRAQHVLLKGGHIADPEYATDLFFDGTRFLELRARRESGYEVRGTGCLLAAALAALLANDKTAPEAAREAKMWLTQQYRNAQSVGLGRRIAAI